MLDIKFIRENPELVREKLVSRGENAAMATLLKLDEKRRHTIEETDTLKARRNLLTHEIAARSKQKENVDSLKDESRLIGAKIAEGDEGLKHIEQSLSDLMMRLPNLPHDSVPKGVSANDNVVVREWGRELSTDFELKDHLTLGIELDIYDFARGTKITGSGFPLYKGAGAILERALINFMLDSHRQAGKYKEVSTPFLVNRASLTGTSQLPKFEEDVYRCDTDDLFPIPTAEVPITNIHRDELLNESDLPIMYCGYSPCFRREAGSYGKETRGFLRVHQFNKVELVKFVKPEDSYDELEKLVVDATNLLEALEIRYRILLLCTGDIGFGAAKCYDIEVWAPSEKRWLEASSCSNFEAFQARRANIRFRRKETNKPEYVHTLNGSGLATSRLIVAMLESYQQDDGTLAIPAVLRKYTGFSLITPDGYK